MINPTSLSKLAGPLQYKVKNVAKKTILYLANLSMSLVFLDNNIQDMEYKQKQVKCYDFNVKYAINLSVIDLFLFIYFI